MDSKTDKSIFKDDVCRLCAKISESLVCIFDNSSNKVSAQLKQCFPTLQVKEDDLKPKRICCDCSDKLDTFNDFLLLCLASDMKFDSCIKYEQNHQTEEDAVKESLGSCVWGSGDKVDGLEGPPAVAGGVLVLSEMDDCTNSSPVEDYVVMVEVKYKNSLPEISCTKNDSHNSSEHSEHQASTVDDELSLSHRGDKSNGVKVINCKEVVLATTSPEEQVELTSPEAPTTSASDVTMSKKKPFECPFCLKTFPRRTRLNWHLASHTDVRPHVCQVCGKSFPMRWALSAHQRVHTGVFACPVCRKAFPTRPKLERHSRVHTGEKPYTCPQCGKGFGEKRNLDNHLRTHTGEKPFLCPICYRGFSVRSHVNDHITVHSAKTMYECPFCFKKFKWKNNCNRHIKSHKTPS